MRKPLHPISSLIIKHLEGKASAEEKQALDSWINDSAENQELFDELCDEYRMSEDLSTHSEDKKATWAKILTLAPELQDAPVKQISWMRYAGVAGILLLIGLGVWYFNTGNKPAGQLVQTGNGRFKNDIPAPVGTNATLVLADGKQINLDAVNNGQVADQGAMQVVKQEDGTIEYRGSTQSTESNQNLAVLYNTIQTNKGGRYKIVLADNSIVWLNAVSSLKYPTTFPGEDRVVELTGEAYFEVAKSQLPKKPGAAAKRRPFIVKVNGMQVDVLGTHFNVMSYNDESAIRTTLLEGSVRVTPVPVSGGGLAAQRSQLLSPGQQATLSLKTDQVKVTETDTEEAVAWKNEVFVYSSSPIENIMREVARNYDVEVVYEGARPTDKFNVMGVPRNVPVSQILKVLELTDKVRFEIEGRKITVKRAS
ncbi:FecR family protein [Paraflavitalea soli]|uniref:FecR family protein n=1 Tax=Paraflavitalea soli TaxID=2315862 RepID=A0A3B7ML64_9BACT|nr:FecR family protein [Paraflavitalea soli]AXY75214.1 FecR family protein [Paraflavitalea soli]